MNQDTETKLLPVSNKNDSNEPIIEVETQQLNNKFHFHIRINSKINKTPGRIHVQGVGSQFIIRKTQPYDDEGCCNIS